MKIEALPSAFGVAVEDYTDADFAELHALVFSKLVVVIRNQGNLSPVAQLELTKRFDPESEAYGHGNNQALLTASVLVNDLVPIPIAPQVKLLGNGPIENHEGIPFAQLKHPQHHTFHKDILSAEDEAEGFTRFYRWHMDAALYGFEPPVVTTLLALKVPNGAKQTIRYDDGSGDFIADVPLGATAFVSGELAFEALSPEQKEYALKTKVKYAPHPYIWIKNAKAISTGLGIVSEGLELSPDELPPVEEEKIKIYPMVWKNRYTGKLSLQLHGCCVLDLLTDGQWMGDLVKVREKVNELMRPGIAPSKILLHDWKEGDLVIFCNRSLWHSVVGTLKPDEHRVYHQCNLAGSLPPLSHDE